MPLSTVGKMGRLHRAVRLRAADPTQTSRPPRRREAKACSNTEGITASTTATSAPPSASIAATGSVVGGVDHVVGAELGGHLELRVLDVYRDHGAADEPGVLHGQVAEAADAEDGDPLGRADVRRP